MELVDVLRAVRRRGGVVLGALILASSVAWLTSPSPPREDGTGTSPRIIGYTSSHVLMSDRDEALSEAEVALPLLAKLTKTGDVPRRVAEKLGLNLDPESLASQVKLEPDTELGLLTISSEGRDHEVAELVDAYAEEVLRFAAERNGALRKQAIARTEAIIELLRARVAYLDARLVRTAPGTTHARLLEAERDATLTVYSAFLERLQTYVAQPPDSPGLVSLGSAVPIPTFSSAPTLLLRPSSNPATRMGFAAVLGLVAGFALAVAVDRLDRRIRGREETERASRLPIIAEIPAIPPEHPTPQAALDAYGRLAIAMLHAPHWLVQLPHSNGTGEQHEESMLLSPAPGRPPRTVLVSSPSPGDGRTRTTAHLAAALSATGRTVAVLTHTDERMRVLAHLGGRSSATDRNAWTLPDGTPVVPSATPGVFLSAAVRSASPTTAASHQATVLQACLERVDLVLIDAGPLLSAGDASAWAVVADAVLVVARAGHTTLNAVRQAGELLARIQVRVLGLAFIHEPISPLARLMGRARGEQPHGGVPPWSGSAGVTPQTDGRRTLEPAGRTRSQAQAGRWFTPSRDGHHSSEPAADGRAWTATAAASIESRPARVKNPSSPPSGPRPRPPTRSARGAAGGGGDDVRDDRRR